MPRRLSVLLPLPPPLILDDESWGTTLLFICVATSSVMVSLKSMCIRTRTRSRTNLRKGVVRNLDRLDSRDVRYLLPHSSDYVYAYESLSEARRGELHPMTLVSLLSIVPCVCAYRSLALAHSLPLLCSPSRCPIPSRHELETPSTTECAAQKGSRKRECEVEFM